MAASPTPRQRGRPEADIQRQIVTLLRAVLPKSAIVHHVANEVGSGGAHGRIRQAILTGMGVHAGFSDLLVLSDGRALFLEVKSASGRLSPAQADFRDAIQAQGFAWALVRSPKEALETLKAYGFRTRLVEPRRSG